MRMNPPRQLWGLAFGLGLLGWGCSALRHGMLQSNAYDLGLFDQWVWLISQGQPPISSMEQVHVLADHGAWLLYGAGLLYRLFPSVQWLLGSQALALSLTAIPLWTLGRQAGLNERRCWLACGLWWLQPVVFNTLLFDMHPETWVMPVFAFAIWAERDNRPRLWLLLLVVMLGARDGLVLVIGGMGLDLALRHRWRWSGAAFGLAAGWLLLLSRWLYPLLRDGEGPKAAGRMFGYLLDDPHRVIQQLDWSGGLIYLLLLVLPCGLLWRRRSGPVLLIGLPLVLVNLLSASPSYRTLVHHYSLPLAVVAVTAAIDGGLWRGGLREGGLRGGAGRRGPALALIWASACWLALAKPWFFTGPYLERISLRSEAAAATAAIPADAGVLTTSYLVPHLSARRQIAFPKKSFDGPLEADGWTALLLHPSDPGWGSSKKVQQRLLNRAHRNDWDCRRWPSGLELCLAPGAAPPPPLGSESAGSDRG